MKKFNALGPVLGTAVLTALLSACSQNGNADATQIPVLPAPTGGASSSSEAAALGNTYADGTFAAIGNYRSPAGGETVEISLTLKDGIIADATFKGDATAPRSQQFQGKFAAGFKEQVVGKSIDTLALGAVNGSSLTPKGFMDAVEKIKAEASA